MIMVECQKSVVDNWSYQSKREIVWAEEHVPFSCIIELMLLDYIGINNLNLQLVALKENHKWSGVEGEEGQYLYHTDMIRNNFTCHAHARPSSLEAQLQAKQVVSTYHLLGESTLVFRARVYRAECERIFILGEVNKGMIIRASVPFLRYPDRQITW